jgi:hypothetical protein
MTPAPSYTTTYRNKRKFLLMAPLLTFPFLCIMFYSLGGGREKAITPGNTSPQGFNSELPAPRPDKEKDQKNKLDLYNKADQDSLKRKEYLRQDPYRTKASDSSNRVPDSVDSQLSPDDMAANPNLLPHQDPKAAELLRQIDRLRESIGSGRPTGNNTNDQMHGISRRQQSYDDEDPQLQKLNTMLDKIIRIQHPREDKATEEDRSTEDSPAAKDTGTTNAIPATISEDQTLTGGATIALRLTDSASIGAVSLPKDQQVYGVVSVSNDRMLIIIHSIRQEHSIYPTSLEVYDMDGLPGIHIPGTLDREVAKQSADQGINTVNLSTFDPSLGAQAANAGIQTARTLLSRKVKLIRISIRAGYQVLLYPTHPGRSSLSAAQTRSRPPVAKAPDQTDPATRPQNPPTKPDHPSISPPQDVTLKPFLHHSATTEQLTLTLRGLYLRQNILWFSLLIYNDGPIDYIPAYIRWIIRDRHQLKRTAMQDLPLTPIYSPPPPLIPGNSNRSLLVGFRPFALPGEKELVLQIGEANGARTLTIAIGHKEILKTL